MLDDAARTLSGIPNESTFKCHIYLKHRVVVVVMLDTDEVPGNNPLPHRPSKDDYQGKGKFLRKSPPPPPP